MVELRLLSRQSHHFTFITNQLAFHFAKACSHLTYNGWKAKTTTFQSFPPNLTALLLCALYSFSRQHCDLSLYFPGKCRKSSLPYSFPPNFPFYRESQILRLCNFSLSTISLLKKKRRKNISLFVCVFVCLFVPREKCGSFRTSELTTGEGRSDTRTSLRFLGLSPVAGRASRECDF